MIKSDPAARDCVVAFFPGHFDLWNIQHMGGLVHLGFQDMDLAFDLPDLVHAVHEYSAAREETMWTALAHFVLNEPPQGPFEPLGQVARCEPVP